MAIWLTTLGLRSSAQTIVDEPRQSARLVFLMTPGPGGGGGGGGLRQKARPPAAKQEGQKKIGNPLPVRRTPPAEPISTPPDPKVLPAEPLPPIVAPVVVSAPDPVTRPGTLEPTKTEADSHGPGTGGGVGTGKGAGIGEGEGAGLGPGSGGGTGGGPYRPGSGIEPPRLIKEIKPDYPDEARAGTSKAKWCWKLWCVETVLSATSRFFADYPQASTISRRRRSPMAVLAGKETRNAGRCGRRGLC